LTSHLILRKRKKAPACSLVSSSSGFLPYGRHTINEDDVAAVERALKSNWLTTGSEIEAFEQSSEKKAGARYAVACSSGTASLHLTALALGLGDNDKIIVPTLFDWPQRMLPATSMQTWCFAMLVPIPA